MTCTYEWPSNQLILHQVFAIDDEKKKRKKSSICLQSDDFMFYHTIINPGLLKATTNTVSRPLTVNLVSVFKSTEIA